MALIGVFAFLPPAWPEGAQNELRAVGLVLVLTGLGLAIAAAMTLGRSLSPFPRPRPDGELVKRGPFAVVRHPIYAGGLLVFAGIALATSVLAFVGTLALVGLWVGKIRVEEQHLRARYPGYRAYERAVRFRIVPGIY
jgi:protein-S-isoprenylcysteine O-methyltransferase Ste14